MLTLPGPAARRTVKGLGSTPADFVAVLLHDYTTSDGRGILGTLHRLPCGPSDGQTVPQHRKYVLPQQWHTPAVADTNTPLRQSYSRKNPKRCRAAPLSRAVGVSTSI